MKQSAVILTLFIFAACGDDSPASGLVGGDVHHVPDYGRADATADLPQVPDLPAMQDQQPWPEVVPEDTPPNHDVPTPSSCGFDYDFPPFAPAFVPPAPPSGPDTPGPDFIAWLDPAPAYTFKIAGERNDIVMPGFSDDMPLFDRGRAWNGELRCYETPLGVQLLSESQAYDLYRDIAELTTGVTVKTVQGVRSVVGLRGAYPGTFAWHGNGPNRFNDTLVLLWIDDAGEKRAREFSAHTDTGAHDFGWHSSSSLRPNRRYRYINGWHKDYNALKIVEWDYQVRDDTNKNAHWDSDRNGWLPPEGADDHDRTGSGHNIHVASVGGPLKTAEVNKWSAGCQTIPGMASWTEFITNAWTGSGDTVDYFLVDARDVDPTAWWPCQEDGSHQCPFRIGGFPYAAAGNTSSGGFSEFDLYNCSAADEGGAEYVYMFTIDYDATVGVAVDDDPGAGPDIDVHLLDADDPDSCLARDNISFTQWIPPGRYFVIADTYVSGGSPLAGPFNLDLWIE